MVDLALSPRPGDPPDTTRPPVGVTDPSVYFHRQLTQTAPVRVQEELWRRAVWLEGVTVDHSGISVPGARGFFAAPPRRTGPAEAFMRGDEFAHLHPAHDGSLHLTLPPAVYRQVFDNGWGEPHPLVGTMMAYGPRDADELEIVWRILLASYRFAVGAA